jgi:hypothetical protein
MIFILENTSFFTIHNFESKTMIKEIRIIFENGKFRPCVPAVQHFPMIKRTGNL